MSDRKKFVYLALLFAAAYLVPFTEPRVKGAVVEAFLMLQEYAREHVLLCLVPAFFIAGGISVFVSQASVIKYFGARANRALSYGVASVSGSVLAVCSCTVLPLFAGIYQRGAGIGPATAFLYSGPAINVLAIVLTARVLGARMGLARAIGAVVFAVVLGLLMELICGKGDVDRCEAAAQEAPPSSEGSRGLWRDGVFFGLMVAFLVFATWSRPAVEEGVWSAVYSVKWYLAGASLLALGPVLWRWFEKDELEAWVSETYSYALMILPLLLIGVLGAGFLLGRPGHEAMIPARYVEAVVGSSPQAFFDLTGLGGGSAAGAIEAIWPAWTCFFASISGSLMYFATLTEIPIMEGLMGAGMDEGAALSLLLSGPAVSLPSLLVIRGVLGTRKTLIFLGLVVTMSTITGLVYGALAA